MLTALQRRVAEIFFALPESQHFAVAGGAALNAHGLVSRRTDDLDLFSPESEEVTPTVDAFCIALREAGVTVEILRRSRTFARLQVTSGHEATLVDLAYDHRLRAPVTTMLGTTLSVEELAADKVLALFGRGEARDLVDVFALASVLGKDALLDLAREKDTGFDVYVLAQMLRRTDQLEDREFELEPDELVKIRDFAAQWRREIAVDLLSDDA